MQVKLHTVSSAWRNKVVLMSLCCDAGIVLIHFAHLDTSLHLIPSYLDDFLFFLDTYT